MVARKEGEGRIKGKKYTKGKQKNISRLFSLVTVSLLSLYLPQSNLNFNLTSLSVSVIMQKREGKHFKTQSIQQLPKIESKKSPAL
jgi:hypothetical protein